MLATTKTAGNAYANDPDCDAFTGTLVRTSTTTYYDPKLRAWIKRTLEYIDVGRPDAIQPRDVDAELGVEKLEYDNSDKVAGIKRAAAERDKLLGETIQAHMKRVGPVKTGSLVPVTGVSLATVQRHLQRHPETYFIAGRYRGWGLVGVHDRGQAQ